MNMRFVYREGRSDLVDLQLKEWDGGSITADAIRRIPWGEVIDEGRSMLADMLRDVADEEDDELAAHIQAGADLIEQTTRKRGRPRVSAEELSAVARTYREAVRFGADPVLEVAKALGVTRSTASKRVMRAREVGMLGPAVPGKAGEVPS